MSDNNESILKVFEGMSQEEAEQAIKAYENQFGTADDVKRFVAREKSAATKETNKTTHEQLWAQYREEVKGLFKAYEVRNCKMKYRKLGLHDLY